MNVYMLVTVQAANFIEDKHKLCYINKKNAEYIQKIMKDKHNAEFRMLEIELVDTINFKMKTNININDDEYEWGSLCSQDT
tara:strand:- start:356 stop:598 length:243 start_codon:yes stop_codon:yes gene_type:complete